ncbi:MAG: sugar phosphate isomerase/epimerase [Armatimonadetes bacterium]|nr:sugar phosphate isomerase/epimerase [Armatimonadota bacterium]
MKRSQLAINSVSTRGTLEEKLKAYADAGFRNVEFVLGEVKEYLGGGRSPSDLRRRMEDHGLLCIGGFEGGLTAFGSDDSRKQNWQQVEGNCRLLSELGGGILVVGTDGPSESSAEDPLGTLAEAFAAVAGRVRETGVTICIEFNWSPIVKSLRTAVEVARRSGAPNVGVLFDPAHYHCTPSKFEQISADSVPYIRHVHVNDMRDQPGELSNCNSDRVLPGEGCLDLRALFGALERHGYAGFFSIEMFNEDLWKLPSSEAAQRMYQSLLPYCEE